MTIKSVIKMGNPKLLIPSEPVSEFATDSLRSLVKDMEDTMKKENGAGIAAPQIGVNLRVMIFGFEENERYPEAEAVPYTVLINPTIEALSDEMREGWEGCLSVPGLRGLVPRYTHIKYQGFDVEGNLISREAKDFHACVVQHELDHLDGILYPRRIKDLRFFAFEDELSGLLEPVSEV